MNRTPTFAELFTPKLVTVLREGYRLKDLRADAVSGLTVAVVALPLSMAIAIASHLTPEQGLFTAIVGGFLVSALGGSRFQIGGPAGAFIVLVASIVDRHGYGGLAVATAMAGLVLMAAGFLRLGTYVKYIPFPVTVGFTAGIAVIIFVSQLKEMLGLDLAHEPGELLPKLKALWGAVGTARPGAIAIAAISLAIIVGLRRWRPQWPGMLIAVTAASVLSAAFGLDIATVGARFGELPRSLPTPSFPAFDLATLVDLVPDAAALALLGAIESLLSAVVADGMTGRRHRSNCELVAQGAANIASVAFGGMPVTGTIARTATNVRAGARGPVSGMLHSAYLLIVMVAAAPLAGYIPLAALSAVLAVVAGNMAEREEFVTLLRASRGDAVILLATFGLTIFVDLATGIAVGVTLGAFVFLHRMAEATESGVSFMGEDAGDGEEGESETGSDADVVVYRVSGALFFGAAANIGIALDRIASYPKTFIFDLSAAPLMDVTAARTLRSFVGRLRRAGVAVFVVGAKHGVRRALIANGLGRPNVRYAPTVAHARERAAGLGGAAVAAAIAPSAAASSR